MDEWDLPLEETGEFDQQNDEGTSAADAGWKDELNLAEFPIAALTDRIPDGQTTMVFEDQLERRDNAPIIRRLTILGTHKHGLPTSLDDEVLVGLIQLTKRRSNFTDARVQFSRYELIELLGWPQSGQSYRRIEEALHRWVGVVLMYENAWWDNVAKSWVDEQFHVLDNVTLYDRERWRGSARSGKSGKGERGGSKADKPPLPLSSFRWNEVIFQSFQSGNLKQLDLEFYLKLRLPTTKRMYRFLDKRFYRRSRLDFDLRSLACEHIGLSRSYAPTELKRRLKPALEELEQLGFLEPLGPEERYSYVKRGCWKIIFIRGRSATAEAQDPAARQEQQPSELVEALKARGVTARTAQELVETHPPGRIRTKLEVFDWLLRNEDRRIGKNPAGYLVASIRSDYQAPVDYQTQALAKPAAEKAKRLAAAQQAQRQAQDQRDQAREARLRAAWEKLPEAEREAIRAAVKAENPSLGRWKNVLEPLYLAALEARMNSAAAGTATGQRLLFSSES
ncbi:MAG TPA: replication initiator protein A [Isosphaeraceae bacterium]|nr:replication initiator protein A [Isosphaeraceae bacterium]